jgi:hypothetical protein
MPWPPKAQCRSTCNAIETTIWRAIPSRYGYQERCIVMMGSDDTRARNMPCRLNALDPVKVCKRAFHTHAPGHVTDRVPYRDTPGTLGGQPMVHVHLPCMICIVTCHNPMDLLCVAHAMHAKSKGVGSGSGRRTVCCTARHSQTTKGVPQKAPTHMQICSAGYVWSRPP